MGEKLVFLSRPPVATPGRGERFKRFKSCKDSTKKQCRSLLMMAIYNIYGDMLYITNRALASEYSLNPILRVQKNNEKQVKNNWWVVFVVIFCYVVPNLSHEPPHTVKSSMV